MLTAIPIATAATETLSAFAGVLLVFASSLQRFTRI
jgi:hypothetical protein